MNVLFLDYDGVVNTSTGTFENGSRRTTSYYTLDDEMVNDFFAVKKVSEFCLKYDYSIVVTSMWRKDERYIQCLKNSGLDERVRIIGKTGKAIDYGYTNKGEEREKEIAVFLRQNLVDNYVILDDDRVSDVEMCGEYYPLSEHTVICNPCHGFNKDKYEDAVKIHKAQE